MSTIIFTSGAKGGTGKSLAVRFLTTYLRENDHKPVLLDMDDENRTLSRFFPEAQRIEIKKSSSNDVLVEKVTAGTKLIIADLKAGTGKDTLKWWLDVPFDELPNVNFICLASITSSPDSVQSFLNWANELQGKVSYVVIKNQKDGNIFPDYEKSNQSGDFREKYMPIEIVIPRLDDEYMTELERLNLTISEVLEANGATMTVPTAPGKKSKPIGDILCRLMVRARLRRFQNDIYQQFDPILKLLSV